MKKWMTVFALFIITGKTIAQTVTPEIATVTATINPQLQRETGRNIIIVKGTDLQHFPVNSIDELLRYAAGVEVQQRGPQGVQSDLMIRGGTFQQVLVLVDGMRLNDPLTGHFSSYIPVHPSEIERIEILKGNASALYGPDAVGGVIHIITKAFSNRAVKQGKKAGIQLQLGDFGLRNISTWFNTQQKNTYWSLGFSSNNADGNRLRGTKGFFNLNTLQGAVSTNLPNNWKLNAKLALDYRNFNAQNFYTTFSSDTATEKVNSAFSHVQLTRTKEHRRFNADISYKLLADEFQFNRSSPANENKTRQMVAQMGYQSKLSAESDFVTGMQLQQRVIRSNDRGDHQLWHGATWFLVKHRLGNHFFMNESIRADWDESYGVELTPQLNLSYTPSRWSLRAAAGKGIRDADFTERYNNYNRSLVRNGSIGNPGLEAEQTWAVEAGADYLYHPSFKLSGTVFYRNQRNLIDWTPTPYAQMPRKKNLVPTGNYALARNIEQVNTYGAELDITFKKDFESAGVLTATSGFTLLRSKNSDSIPSFYTASHAKLLYQFAVLYDGTWFNLAINGLYKERNAQSAAGINATITKNYFLLNMKAAAKINNGKMNIFVQAHNLFGKEYSDLLGSRMPGRWMSGGLAIEL
jgi:vitamin B12 transporter